MKRRDFNSLVGLGSLALVAAVSKASGQTAASDTPKSPVFIALVYPGMILLDLTGPLTCFNMMMGKVQLVSKTMDPVMTDVGIAVQPNATYASCPQDCDVLFVPGGLGGTTTMLEDSETVEFLRSRGASARYITSVCTGSLLLGAAGLLKGKRATSHWYTRDLLPLFGATPVEQRVVEDGNVITGGGVTAGIDFGLVLTARIRNEDAARFTQLLLEYDPHPPYAAGSPEKAGPELTSTVRMRRIKALDAAKLAATRAAKAI